MRLGLVALLLAVAVAEPLMPVDGIKLGTVRYVPAATRPDGALERALARAFQLAPGSQTRYFYNPVALTKTGKEALVMLIGPEFSGSGGSTAAVFQMQGEGYALVTEMTVMRNPVVVADTSTKGWHDLIVRTSGGGMPARFVRLRFDGKSYPTNPTSVDPMPKGSVVSGTAYLATEISPSAGLVLKVGK